MPEMSKGVDAKSLGALIRVLKAFRKFDVNKTITFHSRIKKSKDFAKELASTADVLANEAHFPGQIWTRYVSGEMSNGEREDILDEFTRQSGGPAVVSNATCLGEGVDVPTIDGIAFIDPKRSQIDIVQAVGRAIRKSKIDKPGTIIMPVFIKQGKEPEAVLQASDFKDVWAVVNTLRDHDARLAEEIDSVRLGLGREGAVVGRRPDTIVFDLPAGVSQGFVQAFDARLVDRCSSSFYFWLGLLQNYAAREGDAVVPVSYREGDFRLGQWVHDQRIAYRRGKLSADRIAALKAIDGWVWRVLT